MGRYAEKQLMCHLTDEDSLTGLVAQGFNLDLIPTADLRTVVTFALDYFMSSGREVAPNAEVFEAHELSNGRTIANALDDLEIPWRDGYEASLEWIIEDLKSSYITSKAQTLMRAATQAMAEADAESRLDVFSSFITEGTQLVLDLAERRTKVNMVTDVAERLYEYEQRAANLGTKTGLTWGLDQVDEATGRLHKGELGLLAAYAKLGKSYALDRIALKAHAEGMPVALFTLENSIEMTLDRMACLATGVDPTRWQRGECPDIEVQRVRDWISDTEKSDTPLHILHPDPDQRTPQAMVRMADILEVEAMIVDQLSHVVNADPKSKRADIIEMEKLRQLRLLCSTGRHRKSCMVAHQINREGKKIADKRGWHEMYDMAETSGAEREVDIAISMYQSNAMAVVHQVLLQILAFRRGPIKWWDIVWRMDQGFASVRGERVPYQE